MRNKKKFSIRELMVMLWEKIKKEMKENGKAASWAINH